MNWDDINWEKSYDAFGAYGQSKLCNVIFTRELAKRLENTQVTTYSLHPGVINTELTRYIGEVSYCFNIFDSNFLVHV
jgi:NAD(P)-dependent dehydrogenase (short-subunit alcohol dehydrogenase family)